MNKTIHRSDERGRTEHGWLHSRFSFSFADYYDSRRMGFGALRVINDDIIESDRGFGMHPHRNMEIISIVTKGALEHKDSEGNHGIIKAGEIQYMSAGSGIFHSEYNPSSSEAVELFQIWIMPEAKGGRPRYAKRDFTDYNHRNQWTALVSKEGEFGSLPIRQDAKILSAYLEAGQSILSGSDRADHGRLIFLADGEIETVGETLRSRDEIQISDESEIILQARKDSNILLFDIPLMRL